MSRIEYERREDGRVVAWVFSQADRVLLRRAAELMAQDLGAEACERFDGGDQVFWDFTWMGAELTLTLDRRRGLAVHSSGPSAAAEALTRRVAEHLEARLA